MSRAGGRRASRKKKLCYLTAFRVNCASSRSARQYGFTPGTNLVTQRQAGRGPKIIVPHSFVKYWVKY
jgi:hypothetical protein